MSGNVQKTPIARTLNEVAHRRAASAIELLGQSLPASVVSRTGAIVEVKFEIQSTFTLPNITVPLIGSEFIRLPIAAGTKGWVMTADAYLGGMTGLGGGTASLAQRANLTALVWSPVGNKAWDASELETGVVIYGPDGTIIRNTAKTAVLKVTTAECSMTPPSGVPFIIHGNVIINGNMQISGSIQNETGGVYAGDIKTSGDVIAHEGAGPVALSTHTHTQPNDSHGDTELPTASPTAGS